MYQRSEAIIPQKITQYDAIHTIFTIGGMVEVEIFTMVNAVCIMEKFLQLESKNVKNCVYDTGETEKNSIYKIPIERYYSDMLAYSCLILSSKYYEWFLIIDVDDNYGYKHIGSEYIYKMEADIFFSIGSAAVMEKDKIFLHLLGFCYWWNHYSSSTLWGHSLVKDSNYFLDGQMVGICTKICYYLLC